MRGVASIGIAMRSLPSFVLIAVAIVMLVLLPDKQPILGMDHDTLARVAYWAGTIIIVSSWLARVYHGRLPQALQAIAVWLTIAIVLVADLRQLETVAVAGNRILGSIMPGMAIGGHGGEVILMRSGEGTFPVSARVNGVPTQFLFDTGASSVVVRYEDAARLGIPLAKLTFSVSVSTANGAAQAAPVTLDSVSIGSIRLTKVHALVSRAGTLRENLLGHSFLSRLESYTVSGDRLILRGRAF